MPVINIEGRRVTVGDEFLQLPPEEQNAAVEEIAHNLKVNAKPIDPRMAGFEKEARDTRAQQGGIMANVDTAVRGIGRGLPFYDDFSAGVDTLIGKITGHGESYADTRDKRRAMAEVDRSDRPVAAYGAEIGGGLMLPVGAAAKGATLAQKMAQGAKVGAGYGAAYGASEGDGLADRASRAIGGGLIGGLAGGAAPPVLDAIGIGARALGDVGANVYRSVTNPEGEAARRVAKALELDNPFGAHVADRLSAEAGANGQPLINADRGGEMTRALMRSAANNAPEGRQALEQATSDRFGSQASRVSDWLANTFGDLAKYDVTEALKQKAKALNRPAYDKAYAKGEGMNLWDDELAALAQAPDVQDAIRAVSRKGQNRAVVEGYDPIRNPFVTGRDGNLKLKMTQSADGTITPVSPNLQFWDNVGRNLGDRIETLKRQGGNEAARDAIALKQQLQAKLDGMVPEFAEARQGASRFFGAQDALEAGSNFLGSTVNVAEAKAALAKMNPAERELFKTGYVDAIRNRVGNISDRTDVPRNTIFSSENGRQKAVLALGAKDAAKLEAMLHVERIMNQTKAALGNSTTARQWKEMGLASAGGGGIGAALSDDNKTSGLSIGAVVGGASARGKAYVSSRLGENIAKILASEDPRAITRVMQTAAASPKWMAALREIAEKVALQQPGATAAEHSSGLLPQMGGIPLPGPRAAAADDDKRR